MSDLRNESTGDRRIDDFIEHLADLDPGAKARLKRNAGHSLAESRGVLGVFYHSLPGDVPRSQQEYYFMIATLYPLADDGGHGNFGTTLRIARSPTNGRGLDRRVEVLLDADRVQLPFRLRQAVHFAQSNRVPVNWRQLLRDVLWWDHEDRFVQRRWAESYFSEPASSQRASRGRASNLVES